MATILIVPLPERGHINPTLKIARALAQRGHRVIYASFADAEALIRPEGFEFHALLSRLWPAGYRQVLLAELRAPSLLRRLRGQLAHKRVFNALHQAMLEGEVDALLHQLEPDLLICDTLVGDIPIIAHGLGIPALLFNATLFSRREPGEPPVSSHLIPDERPLTRVRMELAWRKVALRAFKEDVAEWLGLSSRSRGCLRQLARKHRLPPERLDMDSDIAGVRFPELVTCPREFVEFSHRRPEGEYLYVEPCIDLERAEPDFPMSRLEAEAPLVLLSLGSMPMEPWRTERLCALAAGVAERRPGWHVALATGRQGVPPGLDQSRPNLSAMQYLPQLKLLGRAAAMVTHAGLNSVKECIYFGVPMVAVPCQFDQPGLAARVAYHGLGVRAFLEQLTADSLVALLDEVMHVPRYRQSLQAMRARFHEAERTANVADAIERFLAA